MFSRVLMMGGLALLLGVALRLSTAPSPAVADPSPQATATPAAPNDRPRWDVVWTRPAPDLVSCSLASDGSNIAWVDRKGAVRRIQPDGRVTLC